MPFWTGLGNTLKDMAGSLPVVGGLIQSNINAKVARENTDKTIAANRALAEYQYQKDLEMWNKGNLYNSPMEQMRRLKAAGLNPNMVYGSGSAAGMSAGQLPKYNAPTVDYNYIPPVDIPSTIGMFQDFRMKSAQIRNQEQQYTERNQPIIMSDGVVKPYFQVKQINEQTDKQYGWQVKQAEWERRRQADWIKMPQYQSEVYKEQARKLQLEQDRLVSATRNLDLQNEYFAARAISDMFGKGVGAMKGISSMFNRAGQGAKAIKPAGRLSSETVRAPQKHRYNSSAWWDEYAKTNMRSKEDFWK